MSTTTLPSGCGVCGKKEDVSICSSCKVMLYCGREHQAAHRPAHKAACNTIRKMRRSLDAEEESLRLLAPDLGFPGDPFETCVGMFWGIPDTRPYMRARFGLFDALRHVKHRKAVEDQFYHVMDCMRLCERDNMGLRHFIAAIMLRLDKDQEAYDFIKWWFCEAEAAENGWEETNMEGEDALEPIENLRGSHRELGQLVSITLLKIKLLLDLKELDKCASTVGRKVPREILYQIQQYVPRSHIIGENKNLVEQVTHTEEIERLEDQVSGLFLAVQDTNRHFWKALMNPGRHLAACPEAYSPGSIQEVQHVLKHLYDSWVEVPGAINIIRGLLDWDADDR